LRFPIHRTRGADLQGWRVTSLNQTKHETKTIRGNCPPAARRSQPLRRGVKSQIGNTSLDEAAPGATVVPVSDFEAYWGFPHRPHPPSWEDDSAPIHVRCQVKASFVQCQVKPVSSRRRYFWLPELTNLTDESRQERRDQISPPSRAAKSPRRPVIIPSPGVTERRASDGIHVRRYLAPNWFTAAGVAKKRKLIEAKGMPNLQGWRFITLTMSRNLFDNPLQAYLAGSDHMRRFLHECRKGSLWRVDALWCWKFEFQKDGWPHWHLLVERKNKMTHDELLSISRLWSFGRTNVEMVNQKEFRYDFKYAFKPVVMDNDHLETNLTNADCMAPAWFLDYHSTKTVLVVDYDLVGVGSTRAVEKPCTFSRVRFWQTSRGFYTGIPPEPSPAAEPISSFHPRTVRTVLDASQSTVQVVARSSDGEYLKSTTVTILGGIDNFWNLVGFDCTEGGACGLSYYSFVIPPHRLTTDPKTTCLIQPLLKLNRLTVLKARCLRDRGETLQRI
jgi:hypothetical protein